MTEPTQPSFDDWKKALQAELKLPEIGQKMSKKTIEGVFDILSVTAAGQVIPNLSSWKKSSQTYSSVSISAIEDDLANGVRVFFFDRSKADSKMLSQALKVIEANSEADKIEVVFLNNGLNDDSNAVAALEVANQGGTHLQELSLLNLRLIQWASKNPLAVSVTVFISTDNHFFQSIAKLRAFRENAETVFSELRRKVEVRVVSIVNTRDWTLYERYNNMLRNSVAVAGALVGGADVIQTLGYMTSFENEISEVDAEHLERSRRMARNTIHILSLESMLGMVEDAAAGSYHFEVLTDDYGRKSWAWMQSMIQRSDREVKQALDLEITATREARIQQFNRRQLVLSGINDYPNVSERLDLKAPLKESSFRIARAFEMLRLRVEAIKKPAKVRIVFWGDYAALNARLNFTKNYFELLGLTVLDPMQSVQDEASLKKWTSRAAKNEIIVLCAKDEDYAQLVAQVSPSTVANFVAGKVDVDGYEAIFGGQNIFPILEKLVACLEVNS
jgi:hypothetical protein